MLACDWLVCSGVDDAALIIVSVALLAE